MCQIELEDFEADDLIATYARHAVEAGAAVTIVSSDKDMMQLVGDKVTMLDPIKNRPIGAEEVREKFGVDPDKVIEVQALCGDSVDNVPGVPGIGVKTAAELINAYGDLETLLARAAEIKQPKRRQSLIENEAKARLSKELVTLDDDVPLPCPLSALAVRPLDPDTLLPFLREMEFRALATRMMQRLSGIAPVVASERPEPVIPEVPPFTAPRTYALVDTLEGLDHWIEAAYEAGAVAIWPEPSAVAGSRPELAGIALALAPGLAAYVPLGHRAPEAPAPSLPLDATERNEAGEGAPAGTVNVSLDAALSRLRPLLEDPAVLKIGHDVKGAAHLLSRHGVALGPYDCTMLMSYVLDGGQFEHTIESTTKRSFEHELRPLKELIGTGKSLIAFAEVAPAAARDFAAERADAALRLHMLLKARLVRDQMTAFYETIERPLVPVVAAMEGAGIKVDRAALAELSRDFARRIAEIEQAIFRDVGNEFNIGSTKQLGDVLFEKLGLPGGKKGKTGAYGTDASILEELAPLHEVPRRVLEWRQLTKLKSTYADALADEIDGETGRVHTSYALAATATGRFSSTEPNLQNIPVRTEEGRRIRRAFVAEPGHLLLSADYSQIELRLAAHVADIPELKQAFRDGLDIHALTASQVFGVPLGANGRADPTAGEGDQFRHHLRHQRVRARPADRRAAGRGGGLYPRLFRALPGDPRLYGAGQGRVPQRRLCRDDLRAQMLHPRHPRRQPGAPRRGRAAGDQRALAGLGRRHHQAARWAASRRRSPAPGSPPACCSRSMTSCCSRCPRPRSTPPRALVKEVMEAACAPRLELSVPLVVETGCGRNWDEAH